MVVCVGGGGRQERVFFFFCIVSPFFFFFFFFFFFLSPPVFFLFFSFFFFLFQMGLLTIRGGAPGSRPGSDWRSDRRGRRAVLKGGTRGVAARSDGTAPPPEEESAGERRKTLVRRGARFLRGNGRRIRDEGAARRLARPRRRDDARLRPETSSGHGGGSRGRNVVTTPEPPAVNPEARRQSAPVFGRSRDSFLNLHRARLVTARP